MKITPTSFAGLFIIEPVVYSDHRGHFFESYSKKELGAYGLNANFVQDNVSKSKEGVIRGLHFQETPMDQTKLILVHSGAILDIVCDLRKREPTFGMCYQIELSESNRRQLYIPKGFAHGFLSLANGTEIQYKCDNYYHKESESGLNIFDPELGLSLQYNDQYIMSERDRSLPFLNDIHPFD